MKKWIIASYFAHDTHRDLRIDCKKWCEKNCKPSSWDMKVFEDGHGDIVRFEHEIDFYQFSEWYNETWRSKII